MFGDPFQAPGISYDKTRSNQQLSESTDISSSEFEDIEWAIQRKRGKSLGFGTSGGSRCFDDGGFCNQQSTIFENSASTEIPDLI